MSLTADQLYSLLPAIYRIHDVEQGEPLKALMSVIADQAAVIEANIEGLYENWFIETCDEWVVPYIGDLLAVRGLHALGPEAPFSQRALVANTLLYRRRKGTATVLEQLAHDTTGWDARAVEFFELLETTQQYNHVRLNNVRTPDLRLTDALELIDTAFDTAAHTADLRSISLGRGWHNIANIGLFIWRLQSYLVPQTSARAVASPADGRYTFSPLGLDGNLFNRPQTEAEVTHLADETNVPGLLRRRPLYDELESRRQTLVDGGVPTPIYFGTAPVIQISVQDVPLGPYVEVAPEEMLICYLTEPPNPVPEVWLRPPSSKAYQPSDGSATQNLKIKVAADPVLGRLAFPQGVKPNDIRVSYAYGFSGDVGGGPYDRHQGVLDALGATQVTWQVGVSKTITDVSVPIFTTIGEAIKKWNQLPPGSNGVIAIMDSLTYEEDLTGPDPIKIPESSQLLIVAADWPQTPVPGSPAKKRVVGQIDADERRAHVLGGIAVAGTADPKSETPGRLIINGLLIEGKLTVEGTLNGNLGALELTHSTLVPEQGGLAVKSRNDQLKITLTRSICGPVGLPKSVPQLTVVESIVDGAGSKAIDAAGTASSFDSATVIGTVSVLKIDASNSIFTEVVTAVRVQEGCVRFSYVPDGSKTSQRFRCQPDLALANAAPADKKITKGRLIPSFTSAHYGNFGYAQLSRTCAPEIATGADDGSEMGVFGFLMQPQRLTNLQTGFDEYLPFGLEAGVILVT